MNRARSGCRVWFSLPDICPATQTPAPSRPPRNTHGAPNGASAPCPANKGKSPACRPTPARPCWPNRRGCWPPHRGKTAMRNRSAPPWQSQFAATTAASARASRTACPPCPPKTARTRPTAPTRANAFRCLVQAAMMSARRPDSRFSQ